MEVLLRYVKNYLQTTPRNRLYIQIFLFVAIVGGSIIALSFIQKENYQTLFSGLSTEDASMVVAKLKEQKIAYKLGMGGTAIYVPNEKVYDVRLLLASQNSLPGGSGVGFELFDKTSYGMTEFMQNVNYKRAIQGELSRTINQMPEIKASRVHIAIPEKTVFTDREKEVTASVFLKLKPGKVISKDQVAGIVYLVAGSIEGLRPENIVVVDSSGKMLHQHSDNDSAIGLSGQQFELQRSVERKVEESIQSMLDKFLLASRSIVRASVDLNLRKVERVEEEYQPDKNAVTGEKKSREKTTDKSAKANGGVPGAASNVPGKENKQDNPIRTNETEREDTQVTYEVSKSVRKIVEPFGDIKRMSLAIVVDGRYDRVKGQEGEELKYAPRSQKELTDIRNLVARAVGYDEERGDKIEVINMPFEVDNMADEKGVLEKAEQKELWFNVGKYLFYSVIGLAIFIFIIRPIFGMAGKREGAFALKEIKDAYVRKNGIEQQAVEQKTQSVLPDVMKDKSLVGSVIKEWVKEGM